MSESIQSEPRALKQCEIQRYIDLQDKVYSTINFLKNLAGSELYYNDFKDAIIRLEGYYRGMKLADHHNEMIQHQVNTGRNSEAEHELKRLRTALEKIRNIDWGTDHCDEKNMIADDALRGEA